MLLRKRKNTNGSKNISQADSLEDDSLALVFPLGVITGPLNKGLFALLILVLRYRWITFFLWILSPVLIKKILDHYSLLNTLFSVPAYLWYPLLLMPWIILPLLYLSVSILLLTFFGENKNTRIQWLFFCYFFFGIFALGEWIYSSYFILNIDGTPLWIFAYMILTAFTYFAYSGKMTPYANTLSIMSAAWILLTIFQASYPFTTHFIPSNDVSYSDCKTVLGKQRESIRSCNVSFNFENESLSFKNIYIPRNHKGITVKDAFITQYLLE